MLREAARARAGSPGRAQRAGERTGRRTSRVIAGRAARSSLCDAGRARSLHPTASEPGLVERVIHQMSKAIITSDQCLARADEARRLARALPDVTARETLLVIAAGYEKLARYAALAAADEPDKSRQY